MLLTTCIWQAMWKWKTLIFNTGKLLNLHYAQRLMDLVHVGLWIILLSAKQAVISIHKFPTFPIIWLLRWNCQACSCFVILTELQQEIPCLHTPTLLYHQIRISVKETIYHVSNDVYRYTGVSEQSIFFTFTALPPYWYWAYLFLEIFLYCEPVMYLFVFQGMENQSQIVN